MILQCGQARDPASVVPKATHHTMVIAHDTKPADVLISSEFPVNSLMLTRNSNQRWYLPSIYRQLFYTLSKLLPSYQFNLLFLFQQGCHCQGCPHPCC